jgi:hypothetical protein
VLRAGPPKSRRAGRLDNDPAYSILDEADVEVDEKTKRLPSKFQMADDLSHIYGMVGSGFELTNHQFFDQDVEFKGALQLDAIIYERELDLSPKAQASLPQFVAEALLVDALQEARSQILVHRKRRVDDELSDMLLGFRRDHHAHCLLFVLEPSAARRLQYW